ncbi:hypothetical protein ACFHW0_20450 [Micromonospora sp. LOL_025]|uniref:hypothetical protein n=1 Tax=Micromonospora sp. LOL_025 TaxID=3345413 RepID=UPI003A83B7F0
MPAQLAGHLAGQLRQWVRGRRRADFRGVAAARRPVGSAEHPATAATRNRRQVSVESTRVTSLIAR